MRRALRASMTCYAMAGQGAEFQLTGFLKDVRDGFVAEGVYDRLGGVPVFPRREYNASELRRINAVLMGVRVSLPDTTAVRMDTVRSISSAYGRIDGHLFDEHVQGIEIPQDVTRAVQSGERTGFTELVGDVIRAIFR